jgi:hypothetical protein
VAVTALAEPDAGAAGYTTPMPPAVGFAVVYTRRLGHTVRVAANAFGQSGAVATAARHRQRDVIVPSPPSAGVRRRSARR